jgi:hypothetical protein
MDGMTLDDRIPLTDIQRTYLQMVECHDRRPGYIAHARQGSLAALERRSLLTSRPDPTDETKAIWSITAAGREWVEIERANR